MSRIEAVFPLNGDLNKYPFDRYRATLWLLMTTPAQKNTATRISNLPESAEKETPQSDHLAVGATALQKSSIVPLTITVSASTPGVKFDGNVSRDSR
jgi:hypothetical protein